MNSHSHIETVGVLGIGETGTTAAHYFLDQEQPVIIYHREPVTPESAAILALRSRGATFVPGFTEPVTTLARQHKMVLLSPGVLTSSADRAFFQSCGSRLENDLTLFLSARKGFTCAITGSNGKTTTTTLVAEMLKASGKSTQACGNIGLSPLGLPFAMDSDFIPVIEVSNAQLEIFQPSHRVSVALLNNLAVNHLDRYRFEGDQSPAAAYAAYVETKFRLLENAATAIINQDDAETQRFLNAYSEIKARALRFSLRQSVPEGAYLDQATHQLTISRHGATYSLCRADQLLICGRHNLSNALGAALVAFESGASLAGIRSALLSFCGLPHRIEPVGQVEGVRFINDSKSTSPAATMVALKAFPEPMVLILGGDSKDTEFNIEELHVHTTHVKMVVELPGRSSHRSTSAFQQLAIPIVKAASMEDAIYQAFRSINQGLVLLSPAAASQPEFKNYMERGQIFAAGVQTLEKRFSRRSA
jgi:UDP-N-acetylmuramoylalanine--D-glutamate ligase